MSPLASGCVSVTSHSSLRAIRQAQGNGLQLLIKIRAPFLSFSPFYGLFASILDSLPGHPQLPGTRAIRDVGVVQ